MTTEDKAEIAAAYMKRGQTTRRFRRVFWPGHEHAVESSASY